MLWIKEVETVDSVDDLKSSRSIRGTPGPDFELLDARIASALNKIIHNTRFKKKVSLEELKAHKEDRFPSWMTDRLLDLRVLPGHWSQRFCRELCRRRNSIVDDTNPYKLRIRESEKLKTVLELYDLEIHQKKTGPHHHRLKTMVKRSIEQNLRNKNFGARSGNYETNAVVKNQGTKQREQRSLGDCWQ